MIEAIWFLWLGITFPGTSSILIYPKLEVPQITSDTKDFTQSCHFNYHGTDPDPLFTLTWLFDNKIYKTVTLTNGTTSDTLNSADWTGHLREHLSCSVEDGNGTVYQSNIYNGYIMISPDNLTLQEGQKIVISITSTLPVVCPYLPLVLCKLELEIDVKGGYSGDILPVSSCGVQLLGTDWDPSSGTATTTSTIASVLDPVVKPDIIHNVSYTVRPDRLIHQMWANYRTETAKVTLNDEPDLMCMQLGEFHTYTINGNRLYMEYVPADYLLFKSETKTGKLLQIQTRYFHQDVCAVGVQYNGALVIVNMCEDVLAGRVPSVFQGTVRPTDLRVYNCGSDYEIVTGDGIEIVIAITTNIDVKLRVPAIYKEQTGGTCLHNQDSSLRGNSTSIYRVSQDESVFGNWGKRFFQPQNLTNQLPTQYCNCYGGKKECDPFERISNPLSPMAKKNQCHITHPHSSDPELDNYKPSPDEVHISRPGTLGERKRLLCEAVIKNQVPQECERIDAQSINTFVTGCMNDGPHGYRVVSHGFKWSCEETLLRNFSNYHKGLEGELVAPSEVMSFVCPHVCYTSGKCVDGNCVCDKLHTGQSCRTYYVNNGPLIKRIRGGAFCPMLNSTCYEPFLLVQNIIDSEKLEAQVTLLQLQGGKFMKTPLIFHSTVVYENIFSVSLDLSEIMETLTDQTAVGIQISITSDGINYTNVINYYIYDGRCQQCGSFVLGSVQCVQHEGTCVIGRRCYMANERNPANSSEICDPDRGLIQWS